MTILNNPRQNPIVVKAMGDGYLYQMEYKDHQNDLLYILLRLHDLGISDQQLKNVYRQKIKTMDALRISEIFKLPVPLCDNDWLDHLGDKDMYPSYLEFFDRQIAIHGSQLTLQRYFYNSPLAHSIGSQRLPMVHLALGLKHALPKIIGQGLSYVASSYQDSGFLFTELAGNGRLTAHEILIDQVNVDPRFRSFSTVVGQPRKVMYQKILKSTKELLRNYVYLWKVPTHSSDALNELRILAAQMMLTKDNGDNLLKTISAMNILYPNDACPIQLCRVQFLNVICSYILQGRPKIKLEHKQRFALKTMLDEQEIDVNSIGVLFALEEAYNIIS